MAIIGSQDVDASEWLDEAERVELPTGDKTVPATLGRLNGHELIVLPRNHSGRPLAPHAIDYRGNMEALVRAGVRKVLTTAMVASLRLAIPKDTMLLVDQFIEFTKDRQFTYFDDDNFGFADMTEPYCPVLREQLGRAAANVDIDIVPNACYVGVAGPRLETRAEIRMFALLGADIIGHTGTTDAVMAREAGLCFASVAGVITLGAGLIDQEMLVDNWHDSRRGHAARFRQIVTELTRTLEPDDDTRTGCRCAISAPIEK
ncbi:5'-methylthioadenosine phosphorylase [Kibdelosporangium banguiense]|uniref:5'-methylthioadenosine phosphorylase n=1 Tax=Kibdelosporangium banguiense TaxID=1365924 RepID=A0ABS4U1V0_9PSEU|nr:MTAP family purine nucleoside phosphorylase [Kibdelosporangium banguiense]MBP2330644.1 5'-methylthioadenosine phosphorylase [Kibdelosporangium banguiense]